MGRTLPPLFRTVRRVVRILLTRTPCRFLHRVWQNSAKGSIFVWQISAEQNQLDFYRFLWKSTFDRFLRKVTGLALALIWDISPLSVCGFLLMCCFLACKGVRLALILLLRVCRVKRADVAIISPYSTLQSLYIFSPSKKPCVSTVFAFCRGQFSAGKWTVFLKGSGQNS